LVATFTDTARLLFEVSVNWQARLRTNSKLENLI
jgi:hypothetical protein